MTNWKTFWQNYRKIQISSDDDLLFQVGYTVNGQIIKPETFESIITGISVKLMLDSNDILLDLCCGNGIVTFRLSKFVDRVTGIDFSDYLIENAIKYKSGNNISYLKYDVSKLKEIVNDLRNFNKVLLYGGLAYLSKKQFNNLLITLHEVLPDNALIFIGSILDKSKRWQFFDTFKRRFIFIYKYKILGSDPGIGNWWSKENFIKLTGLQGFNCTIFDQESSIHSNHYRFDALLSKK